MKVCLFTQTIIEALKYITTGDLPPNSKGGAFVHDPKVNLISISVVFLILLLSHLRENTIYVILVDLYYKLKILSSSFSSLYFFVYMYIYNLNYNVESEMQKNNLTFNFLPFSAV